MVLRLSCTFSGGVGTLRVSWFYDGLDGIRFCFQVNRGFYDGSNVFCWCFGLFQEAVAVKKNVC